jgi:hypothetical protein
VQISGKTGGSSSFRQQGPEIAKSISASYTIARRDHKKNQEKEKVFRQVAKFSQPAAISGIILPV